jgi:signal transduction histidine kinase
MEPEPPSIADRLLDEARDLFRSVFNESSDAFMVSRHGDLSILEVNDAFQRLTGVQRTEALTLPNGVLALLAAGEDTSGLLERLRVQGHLIDEPLTLIARSGNERHVRLWAHGLQLAGDSCVLTRLSDVTSLFESESRRVRAVKDLLTAEASIRGELAMDLHDDAVQVLTAAALELNGVERRLDAAGDATNSAVIRRIRELLVASSDRTRELMFQLRPHVLKSDGLAPALALLTKTVASQTGLRISVEASSKRYDAVLEQIVWRTVREALINVVHHAGAGDVAVRIHERDQQLACEVEDDGVGFDITTPRDVKHVGIDSMRERVEGLGGSFAIESTPHNGTNVRFTVPLVTTRT